MLESIIAFIQGIPPLLALVLLTLFPFLELRASIPYGILVLKMQWWWVFLLAVVVNILLGPLLYFIMDQFLHLFLKMKWFEKLWNKIIERPRKKIHAAVEKWGELGVAIFIGIPLPGS